MAFGAAVLAVSPAEAQSIDTVPAWDGSQFISTWGEPDTATYGQLITSTGPNLLSEFTFFLQQTFGTAPDYRAYVYEWDSVNNRIVGPELFRSANLTAPSDPTFTAVTIDVGGVLLSPGKEYVIFFSTTEGANAANGAYRYGSVADATYTGGYFVFANNGDDFSALSSSDWNSLTQDLAFSAIMTPLATGEIYPDGLVMAGDVSRSFLSFMLGGKAHYVIAQGADEPLQSRLSFFGGVFGLDTSVDGDGIGSAWEASAAGLSAGVELRDIQLGGLVGVAGLGVGYSGLKGSMETFSGSERGEVDSFHLGLYARFGADVFTPGFGVDAGAAYAFQHFDTSRSILPGDTATASYDGGTFAAQANLRYGYLVQPGSGPAWVIAPTAGVDFISTSTDGFTETGSAAMNFSSDGTDLDRSILSLGVSLAAADASFGAVKPEVHLFYEHVWGDAASSATLGTGAATLTVLGPAESRDRLRFGGSLSAALSENASLAFDADALLSSDRTQIGGSARLSIRY
ncbi:autotransporter outer membrane beta-barrel domain-containing protein [Pseudohoeflea suaedae]|nr:autotransporter outer membrane beta-barrel domain-containing protein [Pseudohoeflea suaedae]